MNGKHVLEVVKAGAKQASRSIKLDQTEKKVTEALDLAVHPSEPYAYVTVKSTNEEGDPRDYMLAVNTQSGEIEGDPSLCSRVAIDRAGETLYCCSWTMLTANSIDSGVRKYKGLVELSYGERTGLRFSPVGRRIVCLQHDEIPTGLGDVSAYNAKKLSEPPMVYETGLQQRPEDVAFHPTLEVVAIWAPGSALLFEQETGRRIDDALLLPEGGLNGMQIERLMFSPDGKSLLFIGTGGETGRQLVGVPLRLGTELKYRSGIAIKLGSPPLAAGPAPPVEEGPVDAGPVVEGRVEAPSDKAPLLADVLGLGGSKKSPPSGLPDPILANSTSAELVAAFEELGAEIMFDPDRPGNPIASVKFYAGSDDKLARIRALTTLTEISANGRDVTDEGLKHLAALGGLQTLQLPFAMVTDAGLKRLSGLENLKSLDITFTRATDAGLKHLSALRNLESFHVGGETVTGSGFAHLKNLSKLRELNVALTNFNDAGMQHLRSLTSLQKLDLRVDITDAGLKHVAELKNLTELAIATSKVTDAGLAYLKGLEKLASLNLAAIKITDAGLERLQGLKNLRRLNLAGTDVTDAGVDRLQAALPKCDIKR